MKTHSLFQGFPQGLNDSPTSFLGRCDPRAKWIGFFLTAALLASVSWHTVAWWLGLCMTALAVPGGAVSWRDVGALLKRLRWFFAALLLLHLFLTPGQILWPLWPIFTREGVDAGLYHLLRLIALATLALVLVRSTTPSALISGLRALLSPLKRVGLSSERWLTTLAYACTLIPNLAARAQTVWKTHATHGDHGSRNRSGISLDRLRNCSRIGEQLIQCMIRDLLKEEQRLKSRNLTELPVQDIPMNGMGRRDLLIILLPLTLLMLELLSEA